MNNITTSRKLLSISLLTTAIALSGCQSTSDKFVEDHQQTQVQNEQFLLSKNAIEDLEQQLKNAEEANIPYFAEKQYEDAIEQQKDAQDKFDDIRFAPHKASQSKTNNILVHVNKAKQFLTQAQLIKDAAEQVLAESLAQIKTLKALNAHKLYAKEFNRSQDKISDLIELIAEGKQAKAQEQQAQILPLLNAIEIKAVKKIELKELKTLLASLKSAKINKIAPISYQKSIGLSQTVESVIATNPKDKDAIKESVALALFEAKHTQNIAIAVRNLIALEQNDYEKYILGFENKLNSVSQALKGDNLRDLVLSEQTTRLVSQGESLNAQLNEQSVQIAQLEQAIASKDELLLAATQDKNSFSTMIQTKLDNKNKQIEQQTIELTNLNQQKQALEQKVVAAEQTVALIKQQLVQLKSQHKLELAQNKLASSNNNLTIEKKQLELEKQIQSLQTELTATKAANATLTQEAKSLNEKVTQMANKKPPAPAEVTQEIAEEVEETATPEVKTDTKD